MDHEKGRGGVVHHHANEQITWITQGEAEVYSQGKKYVMHAGDIMIIPPNVPHEFRFTQEGQQCEWRPIWIISFVFQVFTQQLTCSRASTLMNLTTDTPRAVSSSLDEGSAMSAQPTQKPLCAVVGVGPGNGAAFARRFAAEGYAIALLARTTNVTSRLAQELPLARAYACDAGDPATVERTFEAIESDLGPVDVLIYNAGKGVWGSDEEVTFEDFEAAWRTNTFGAFAAARSVIPAMKRRAAGHIIFVGATASRRGGAKTAAFASAKAAQRSLGQIPRPFARAIEDPCLADHH